MTFNFVIYSLKGKWHLCWPIMTIIFVALLFYARHSFEMAARLEIVFNCRRLDNCRFAS